MSRRWLVIVVVSVFVAVLVVALALTGDEADGPASVPTPTASSAPSPTTSPSDSASTSPSPSPTPSATPTPSPSASTAPAASFSATGDLISGWYWLRDQAHRHAATWGFVALPETGDLTFVVEVLATDAVDGARGQQARFFFAWGPATSVTADDWSGRLPVTLPNVSPLEDPVGYTCRGTVTIPRSTIGEVTDLTVRIGRDDVRGELPPSDVHIAVNASSVKLRLP